MKDKAPLALIEQTVMILVFALAAALCLRVFVWSDLQSKNGAASDRAVIAVRSAAETLKSAGGDFAAASESLGAELLPDGSLCLRLDDGFRPDPEGCFILTAAPLPESQPLYGEALVSAETAKGDMLFSLTVGWQKGGTGDA